MFKTGGKFFKKEFAKLRKSMIMNLTDFIQAQELTPKQCMLMTRGVALYKDTESEFVPYIEGVLKNGKFSVMTSEYGEPEVWGLSQVTNDLLVGILIELDAKKFTIEDYDNSNL